MVARVVWSQLCGSLKEVVDNAAQRWFWECLRQAKLGDAQNQMLVGAPFPLSVKNKTHTVSPCQGVGGVESRNVSKCGVCDPVEERW